MSAAWIDSVAALADQAAKLKPEPGAWLAIDTEADSLHHYKESVCLVSVRQGEETFLLDSLALTRPEELAPFWQVTANAPWILHGADFDLRLMRRLGTPEPPEVFDTMIGAQLCGLKSIGYAGLVEHFFGVKLSKASQKEDWSARPLTPVMLDYAAQDVTYLDGIRRHQTEILAKLGRTEWHRESSARVVRTSRVLKEYDAEEAWRITGANKLPLSALPVVRELWHWREGEAKERDVPTFKVLTNDRLLEISDWVDANRVLTNPPNALIPSNVRGARALRFHDALKRGKALPPLPPAPSEPRLRRDPSVERRADQLKKRRDEIAAGLELDPALIGSKAVLFTLAQDGPPALESLVAENRWCRWQADLLRPAVEAL